MFRLVVSATFVFVFRLHLYASLSSLTEHQIKECMQYVLFMKEKQ